MALLRWRGSVIVHSTPSENVWIQLHSKRLHDIWTETYAPKYFFSFISQHPSDLKNMIWFGSSVLLPPICPHKKQFTTLSKNASSTYLRSMVLRASLEAKAATRYVERICSFWETYLQQPDITIHRTDSNYHIALNTRLTNLSLPRHFIED
jgi:hypothetical protein